MLVFWKVVLWWQMNVQLHIVLYLELRYAAFLFFILSMEPINDYLWTSFFLKVQQTDQRDHGHMQRAVSIGLRLAMNTNCYVIMKVNDVRAY